MTNKIVELKNLTKYYGKARGIIDVTFDIDEGEIFGFIGPNGAGKSTTIRTMLNLIHPTSGESKIFGLNTTRHSAEIAENIGYLPSEIFYYDNMKVRDLLKYSASFYKKDSTKKMKELIDIMELDVNKRIRDLSLGNKKKVGIVQGLQHSPQLIILDEPTSGLDPLMQKRFFDLIKDENKNGATILFSSHILNEVQRLSTRIGIVKEGKLIKLEDMAAIKEHTYKKIRLSTTSKVTEDYFKIDEAKHIVIEDNVVDFLYKGDINHLLAKLNNLEIKELWITDPDLEEIFMHYYIKEN